MLLITYIKGRKLGLIFAFAFSIASLMFISCDGLFSSNSASSDQKATFSKIGIDNIVAKTRSLQGSITGDKSVSEDELSCGGITTVTVALSGLSNISANPVDIMLVLDRSGSMDGDPIDELEKAAKKLVDLIEETNNSLPPEVTEKSRMGVVSFSGSATLDQKLTDDMGLVRSAINFEAKGSTAIGDGIQKAQQELASSYPTRTKIMIVVTDGENFTGIDPETAANAAKLAGTEIFVIGFGGIVQTQLEKIASAPLDIHLFITPDESGLEEAFKALGEAIIVPAATNVEIIDHVNTNFSVSNASVTKGAVSISGNNVIWTIDEIGTETVTLTYDIAHDDTKAGGDQNVSVSVDYSDNEGNIVDFPNPLIRVHGCAAFLELIPESDENIVGEDHSVEATVKDDYGNPISGITVEFVVTGGASTVDGDPSNPMPGSGSGTTTDPDGNIIFTYTNSEASFDVINATVPFGQPNVSQDLVNEAKKTWLPVEVPVDIHPRSCPNPFNMKKKGMVPVAIVGTGDFEVSSVDITKIRLEGVYPKRSSLEDVVEPYEPYTGKTDRLMCTTNGPDGLVDLVLHFKAVAIADAIRPVTDGEEKPLQLYGEFMQDDIPYDFIGEDIVWIKEK